MDLENKQINLGDVKTLLQVKSPDDVKAVQRVYDEFHSFTLGKSTMSVKEVFDLRTYAKNRTNVSSSDEDLDAEQFAWKILYNALDKSLSENIEASAKENLDNLVNEMEVLDVLEITLKKMTELGRSIESELTYQYAALALYFDKGPENHYKMVVDGVTSDLINPTKWTPAERIDKAQAVLELITANKNLLYTSQLVNRQETINKQIREFQVYLEEMKVAFAQDTKHTQDEGIKSVFHNLQQWLSLTKDLHTIRATGITAVKNSIEADEFLPTLVLDSKGVVDETINISGTNFFENMSSVVVLANHAGDEEERIGKVRNPISENTFGKKDDYIKLENSDVVGDNQPQEKDSETKLVDGSVKSTNKIGWIIVVILAVIALSGGIWTAIGVFVLGAIMIGVLKK